MPDHRSAGYECPTTAAPGTVGVIWCTSMVHVKSTCLADGTAVPGTVGVVWCTSMVHVKSTWCGNPAYSSTLDSQRVLVVS